MERCPQLFRPSAASHGRPPYFLLRGTKGQAPPVRKERIKIVRVKNETIKPALETFGTIVYKSKADVYPAVEENIEEIFVEVGTGKERFSPSPFLPRTSSVFRG
jgi:hypothetical protein